MEKSKVYYSDFRALPGTNLQQKFAKLLKRAGIGDIDMNEKFVAVKIHFGEPGNLAYLRPNWAKTLVDIIKEQGGKPFLTDCNTLYVGRRKNALEHMDAAYENGYNPFTTGCQIIIADGLKGTDETIVPIDGELVKEAKIGTAIMDADVFISLSHFKGHESTGFGGAIKNIGMGCGSRAGKMEQHSNGKPEVDKDICKGCKQCAKICAHSAISYDENRKAEIDMSKCVGCGRCVGICAFDAIEPAWDAAEDDLCKKMAEYAYAVCKDRPTFHISLVLDVSPYCDCHAENDVPVIPDIGMFASFDPVALDKACADACRGVKRNEKSYLGDMMKKTGKTEGDFFKIMHPATNWEVQLTHAEKLGLGTTEYELITVK
ncbi:MAG: DUF362 domain-containing protein [Oscillospiraceae bacterium]|nr:DUF362 domain-containing protein [Oscillospiraceae bacterium]